MGVLVPYPTLTHRQFVDSYEIWKLYDAILLPTELFCVGWQWDTFTDKFGLWSGAVKLFFEQFNGKETFLKKIEALKHAYLQQSSQPGKKSGKRGKKSSCDASDMGTVSDDTTGNDDCRSGVCPKKRAVELFCVRGADAMASGTSTVASIGNLSSLADPPQFSPLFTVKEQPPVAPTMPPPPGSIRQGDVELDESYLQGANAGQRDLVSRALLWCLSCVPCFVVVVRSKPRVSCSKKPTLA